jgi:tetratricopeptide (TPR) repeat protein
MQQPENETHQGENVRQYRESGKLNDLETSVKHFKAALDLTPEGHPDRAGRLQSLAASFTDRFRRLGDLKDLEAAFQTNQEAVELTPFGHPDRAAQLQSLATSFGN